MSKVIGIETLNNMKFDCVGSFGLFTKNKRHPATFWIWNIIPPVEFGADAGGDIFDVELHSAADYVVLADFIKNLFGVTISTTPKEAAEELEKLCKHLFQITKPVDWGACHVWNIPFNPAFRKDAAVTIELSDNVPGIVIGPLELPERSIPEDWDI